MRGMNHMTSAALGLLLLAGCNTVQGIGEDIETAGDVIEDSAQETQRHLPRRHHHVR